MLIFSHCKIIEDSQVLRSLGLSGCRRLAEDTFSIQRLKELTQHVFYDPRCLSEKNKTKLHTGQAVMRKGTDGFNQVLRPFAKKAPNLSFIGLEYSNSHSDSKKTPRGKERLKIERKLN